MLLKMEPPVGFGNKCPKPLAYKRLIRMNMPVDENNTVHFTTTLFALIRESLKIKLLSMDDADEAQMDQADEELRHIVMKLWPFLDHKQVKLALPHRDG
jgi:voltage-dependent calcium channel N type alpha-1B